jgi:hypothetical protein
MSMQQTKYLPVMVGTMLWICILKVFFFGSKATLFGALI